MLSTRQHRQGEEEGEDDEDHGRAIGDRLRGVLGPVPDNRAEEHRRRQDEQFQNCLLLRRNYTVVTLDR